jgi:hypothetical protein
MAILTDILIAAPSEAEAIAAESRHSQRWPCVQFNDVNNLVLADLLAALGADDDAEALRRGGRLIYGKGTDGPWIYHLPDTLPTLLAALEDEKLGKVAELWAQGEELSFDRSFLARLKVDVQHYLDGVGADLKQLRDLARQATAANKPLLLWVCL